ncbi:MAG TPA: nitroreductase family deazaflavin-dependent oxidoreductase [Nocardioides sp.]|uniref:nitroreductase family deazaflavin-dependent oxidoreductase n=1 Tax=Nocardioides sp. TaxID=35761 RepID=UPI002ED99C4D
MGLAADLDYRFPNPGPLRRLVQRVAATRAGGWVFSRVLRHLDDVVKRLSRGRTSAPEILAGLPVLELATTGRRSGQVRTSHLIALPCGADLALLGTNFGQPATPAWVLNLEADPKATVSYQSRSVTVLARPASQQEYDEVLRASDRIYPGYRAYLRRITGRRVRIFVLARSA